MRLYGFILYGTGWVCMDLYGLYMLDVVYSMGQNDRTPLEKSLGQSNVGLLEISPFVDARNCPWEFPLQCWVPEGFCGFEMQSFRFIPIQPIPGIVGYCVHFWRVEGVTFPIIKLGKPVYSLEMFKEKERKIQAWDGDKLYCSRSSIYSGARSTIAAAPIRVAKMFKHFWGLVYIRPNTSKETLKEPLEKP